MGLFGKLFEKKVCDLCGGEIGLLGNRKLEDGNCCKHCAQKLSPWFDERRHSTIEQIRFQLDAREKNQQQLETWSHQKVYGEYQKIYFSFVGRIPDSFVICSASDYKTDNADIINLRQVSSWEPDIREHRRELKQKNAQGEEVSFNPPRYEYSYDFYVNLMVMGMAYIDDMRFRLNRSTLKLETVMPKTTFFTTSQVFDPMLYPEYRRYKAMLDEVCKIISCGQQGVAYEEEMLVEAPVVATAAPAVSVSPVVAAVGAVGAPSAVPQKTWVCLACGSENTGKFCQGCGSPRAVPAKTAAATWTCVCGAVNAGKFCNECGIKQFTVNDIECSECSWRAEPGDEFTGYCPSCGHKFGPEDLDI